MIKGYTFFKVFVLSIFLFFVTNCSEDEHPNVGHINIPNIKIERFDQAFFALKNKNNKRKELQNLRKEYGIFVEDYVEKILYAGKFGDERTEININNVVESKPFTDLQAETNEVFKNVETLEQDLHQTFKYITYYYPDYSIPTVIVYISGFQLQISLGDDYIGIGLDMFLGADSQFYPALINEIPRYISKRFTPENIVPRVVEAIIINEFCRPPETKNLLTFMVYYGKILYCLDKFMPYVDDTLKIGYTAEQMAWAKHFESNIWGYFLENDYLYESDFNTIKKFITEAPFTTGLGEKTESAPKLGHFIGWQIVKKYMEKNPSVTLHQLMNTTDAQMILTQSGYRP